MRGAFVLLWSILGLATLGWQVPAALGQANTIPLDETSATTAQLIRSVGFNATDLYFTSAGYILNIVRASNPLIKNGTRRQPLLFIHGILTSAKSFILKLDGAHPQDLSQMDLDSLSYEELEELLEDNPNSESLVWTALNCGFPVYLLNRIGSPQSQRMVDETSNSTFINDFLSELAIGTENTVNNLLSTIFGNLAAPPAMDSNSTTPSTAGRRSKRQASGNGSIAPINNNNEPLTEALSLTIQTLPTAFNPQAILLNANARFWNYSLDRQAEYDIPNAIAFVRNDTGAAKVSIVGHSAGSALTLMALIRHPELADEIDISLLWAAALDLGHSLQSNALIKALTLLNPIFRLFSGPFPPSDTVPLQQRLTADLCDTNATQATVCRVVDETFFGLTGGQQSLKPGYIGSIFNSLSFGELVQLLQSFQWGRMYYYSYGNARQNMIAYNQPTPPLYQEARIRPCNITLWSGVTDSLVTPADTQTIIDHLSFKVESYLVNATSFFNHISFLIDDYIAKQLIIPGLYKLLSGGS